MVRFLGTTASPLWHRYGLAYVVGLVWYPTNTRCFPTGMSTRVRFCFACVRFCFGKRGTLWLHVFGGWYFGRTQILFDVVRTPSSSLHGGVHDVFGV